MASIRLTDPADPKLGDNSHCGDYNINVVCYHDTERSCTGNLNQLVRKSRLSVFPFIQ